MTDRTRDDAALRTLLSAPRRIAVVGASPNPTRDSHRIFAFLKSQGHDVLPVNPVAEEVLGVPCVPDLAGARATWGEAPEIVDVFRAPEHLVAVAKEAVEVGAAWLWCQFGVVNEEANRVALDAGMDLVVDRCILVETRRLLDSS